MTDLARGGPITITGMLDAAAAQRPASPFLRTAEGTLTYRQVRERSDRVAVGLAGLGIGPSERVAILMENNLDQVTIWFALARLRAVHAPINAALRGEHLVHVLKTAGATTVVVDSSLAEPLRRVAPSLPQLRRVVVRGDEESRDWSGVVSSRFAHLGWQDGPVPTAVGDDLDPATLLFTSGTTGRSKACVLSHRYLARQGQIHARQFRLRHDDVLYSPFPLFHIDTATLTVVAALAAGCTAALGHRFSASGFWDEAKAFDATVFNFMGATLSILWKAAPTPMDRQHRVRLAWGVPMPQWKQGWEERFGFPLYQVYGSTDAGVPVYDPVDGTQRPGRCGTVVPEFELAIDGSQGEPGVRGEILVRGREPGLTMSGYHGMPEATADTITRDGWVKTGDVGELDREGFLAFHGRLTDSIRRRGENISAYEVETVALGHPAVVEAAALGVPSDLTEEDLKLCVVLRPGHSVAPADLHRYLKDHAPAFMVPRYIEVHRELPKTPTEKVEKFKLVRQVDIWDAEASAGPHPAGSSVGSSDGAAM